MSESEFEDQDPRETGLGGDTGMFSELRARQEADAVFAALQEGVRQRGRHRAAPARTDDPLGSQDVRRARPLLERGTPGLLFKAYPVLFPWGSCDVPCVPDEGRRLRPVTLAQFVRHLLLFYDPRFQAHPAFLFVLLSMLERDDTSRQVGFFCRTRDTGLYEAGRIMPRDREALAMVNADLLERYLAAGVNERQRRARRRADAADSAGLDAAAAAARRSGRVDGDGSDDSDDDDDNDDDGGDDVYDADHNAARHDASGDVWDPDHGARDGDAEDDGVDGDAADESADVGGGGDAALNADGDGTGPRRLTERQAVIRLEHMITSLTQRRRGSQAFKKAGRADTVAALKDLGFPQLFVTISSADDHHALVQRGVMLREAAFHGTPISEEMLADTMVGKMPPFRQRSRSLRQYPVDVVRAFNSRFHAFLEHVLQPKDGAGEVLPGAYGRVLHYTFEAEFQLRGSLHAHGLVWVDKAVDPLALLEETFPPGSNAETEARTDGDAIMRDSSGVPASENDSSSDSDEPPDQEAEEMGPSRLSRRVLAMADSVMTAVVPAVPGVVESVRFADNHVACRVFDPDATDDELQRDLGCLMMSLQAHRCSANYCLVSRRGHTRCRYGFGSPGLIREATGVGLTADKRIRVMPRRLSADINPCNAAATLILRANNDCQVLVDPWAAVQYICKVRVGAGVWVSSSASRLTPPLFLSSALFALLFALLSSSRFGRAAQYVFKGESRSSILHDALLVGLRALERDNGGGPVRDAVKLRRCINKLIGARSVSQQEAVDIALREPMRWKDHSVASLNPRSWAYYRLRTTDTGTEATLTSRLWGEYPMRPESAAAFSPMRYMRELDRRARRAVAKADGDGTYAFAEGERPSAKWHLRAVRQPRVLRLTLQVPDGREADEDYWRDVLTVASSWRYLPGSEPSGTRSPRIAETTLQRGCGTWREAAAAWRQDPSEAANVAAFDEWVRRSRRYFADCKRARDIRQAAAAGLGDANDAAVETADAVVHRVPADADGDGGRRRARDGALDDVSASDEDAAYIVALYGGVDDGACGGADDLHDLDGDDGELGEFTGRARTLSRRTREDALVLRDAAVRGGLVAQLAAVQPELSGLPLLDVAASADIESQWCTQVDEFAARRYPVVFPLCAEAGDAALSDIDLSDSADDLSDSAAPDRDSDAVAARAASELDRMRALFSDEQRFAFDIFERTVTGRVGAVPAAAGHSAAAAAAAAGAGAGAHGATLADRALARDQLLLLVAGRAGSGKSFLIEAIARFYQARGRPDALRVLAYTGIAARNAGGPDVHAETLHSALGLRVRQEVVTTAEAVGQVPPRRLQELQRSFATTETLVIDEFSMVSAELFAEIAGHLAAIRPDSTNFLAGFNVVLLGDAFQLPPTAGRVLFGSDGDVSDPGQLSEAAQLGRALFRQFETAVELSVAHRQGDDAPHLAVLQQLRTGRLEAGLYASLLERSMEARIGAPALRLEKPPLVLVGTAAHVDAINRAVHDARRRAAEDAAPGQVLPRLVFDSIDTVAAGASLPAEVGKLAAQLELGCGDAVLVLANLATAAGVCNGTRGVVDGFCIRHGADAATATGADVVAVRLLVFDGDPRIPGRLVAIPRVKRHHFEAGGGARGERFQFPLRLAFATTVHKSQGLTLESVAFDSGGLPPSADPLLYTALSRCRRFADFAFIRRPPTTSLPVFNGASPRWAVLEEEQQRLDRLTAQTRARFLFS